MGSVAEGRKPRRRGEIPRDRPSGGDQRVRDGRAADCSGFLTFSDLREAGRAGPNLWLCVASAGRISAVARSALVPLVAFISFFPLFALLVSLTPGPVR